MKPTKTKYILWTAGVVLATLVVIQRVPSIRAMVYGEPNPIVPPTK